LKWRFETPAALFAAVLLLSACSATRPLPEDEAQRSSLYQSKIQRLLPYRNWGLEGRLAVTNEEDGGSGNFRWRESGQESHMDFHGALGRGAWVLDAGPDQAEITLADGTVRRAPTVTELVRREVGWKIPVENLSWWVRGMAVPGTSGKRVLDEQGNLTELQQNGWTIAYDRYREFGDVSLPVRLTAQQAEWKIKLAIRSWSLDAPGEARD
jgi:outer membrane lipoprotein LolB